MTKTSRGIADRLRHNIEVRSPRLMALLARLRDRHLRKRSIDDVFGSIYRDNSWGSEESISGAGSEREGTRAVSEKLPELLAGHGVRSMLDAPCGDFLWMSEINLGIDQYYGVEIVPELVDDLNAKWGSTERLFSRADITRDDLPTADLVLCRDCLVHLSYDHASAALRRFRASGARFLLTTTYTLHPRNYDGVTGSWRALNLERAPFSFPKPLEILDEQSQENYDRALGKSLGLWRIEDLPFD